MWGNDDGFCNNLLLNSARLTHQKGFTEVATRFLTDLFCQLRWEEQTLFFTHRCQNVTHLGNRKNTEIRRNKVTVVLAKGDVIKSPDDLYLFWARQRNSDSQTTTANRLDDLGGRGWAQDKTAGGHVLFHRATQSMLGVLCESVHLC